MDRTTLVLRGDRMLGRGAGRIFPRSVDPGLHEPHVRDALRETHGSLRETAHPRRSRIRSASTTVATVRAMKP